jgi:methionyl-tRNA formyltransferase
MRLVFAGTPQTAVPSLEALLASRHEVAAVVTRPDAQAGRGQHTEPSPVARRAEQAGLEILRPARARDPEFLERLRELAPDCCPVVAYGALLPQSALDIPRKGWVNLHFSLLPAWRGAAPVQHAILHGDEFTGASTFEIVAALDAGPVYGTMTEHIQPDDTTGSLLGRLATAGARLLADTLNGIEDGTLQPVPQPDDGVSIAPKITVADAEVNWKSPAFGVDRQIRACTPEPGAWTTLDGARIKLGPVTISAADPVAPGEVVIQRNHVLVGTATAPVRLGEVQAPGKRRMQAADWARGLHVGSGLRFG